MEMEGELRMNLCGCSDGREEHATWRWLIQDKCMIAATWSFPNTHKMKENKSLTILSQF